MKWTNGRLFIKYKGRWINVALEAQSHGDGFKGYHRFLYHWFRCVVGFHTTGHFATFAKDGNGKVIGLERYTACMYCRRNKQVNDGTDNEL